MILTNCVVEEEKNENSSLNGSINEEDQEIENILKLKNSKSYFLWYFIELVKKTNKEKADNFTDGVIDMNLSNLSKIENKNNSINSSCKSISRFEEQKDMIDLLDNQLNVNQIILFNFYIYS